MQLAVRPTQRISRRIFVAGLAAVASVRPANAQAPATLRVGSVPVDSFAEAYYAQEMGFFAKAGLDVEIVSFTNGAGSTTAIAGGAIDIGISTVTMMANAAIHGLPLTYIAGGALFDNTPTTALVVGKTSPVAAAKDFIGKTVAVSGIKDGTHLALVVWLVKNGVDPTTVSAIELPFPSMIPAIARGTIAGAVCAEPFMTVGADDARVLALASAAIAKRYMTGGWFTSAAWLKANGPVARRFAAAMNETARWANANHERSGQVLAKVAKIDPTVVERMARTVFTDRLTPALIDPILEWAYRVKFTERRVRASEMIANP